MKDTTDGEPFFPGTSDLDNVQQWFPKLPTKPASKLSFFIALLDEILVFVIIIIIGYSIYNRFF